MTSEKFKALLIRKKWTISFLILGSYFILTEVPQVVFYRYFKIYPQAENLKCEVLKDKNNCTVLGEKAIARVLKQMGCTKSSCSQFNDSLEFISADTLRVIEK